MQAFALQANDALDLSRLLKLMACVHPAHTLPEHDRHSKGAGLTHVGRYFHGPCGQGVEHAQHCSGWGHQSLFLCTETYHKLLTICSQVDKPAQWTKFMHRCQGQIRNLIGLSQMSYIPPLSLCTRLTLWLMHVCTLHGLSCQLLMCTPSEEGHDRAACPAPKTTYTPGKS